MTVTTDQTIEIRRAGPRIGAEIGGVDLNTDVEPSVAEQLRQAFRDHKVLVFRGQHLSPDRHVEAVRIFGEPFDHPTATRHPDNPLVYPYRVEQTGKASTWHIGGLWRTPPFQIESLVYDEVAELGGHTLWADLQAAYDDLSEPLKQLLESVSGEYDADAAHYAQGAEKGDVRRTVEHPVVLRHPDTGRRGLFLSTGVRRLVGIAEAESEALLPFLLRHAASPQYTIRFGWTPGDLVLWDNLATWHYAIDDYGDGPRAYRKVIAAHPEG
ncbi:TauD/TfdA dioxygenase family protein [Pseudonocardia endophytica]|uniref:Taurine dioxygenase n=1 Tax=Pseudonocardia endophytica TaxID=401976 RepID=A0A4R1HIL1_PSEEN|nr:TauD/TfdA family dioxygenase [Pseudonocardia endophytica]TCK22124.1 taurine dioxygenase [Pseudonocardia endophytica]